MNLIITITWFFASFIIHTPCLNLAKDVTMEMLFLALPPKALTILFESCNHNDEPTRRTISRLLANEYFGFIKQYQKQIVSMRQSQLLIKYYLNDPNLQDLMLPFKLVSRNLPLIHFLDSKLSSYHPKRLGRSGQIFFINNVWLFYFLKGYNQSYAAISSLRLARSASSLDYKFASEICDSYFVYASFKGRQLYQPINEGEEFLSLISGLYQYFLAESREIEIEALKLLNSDHLLAAWEIMERGGPFDQLVERLNIILHGSSSSRIALWHGKLVYVYIKIVESENAGGLSNEQEENIFYALERFIMGYDWDDLSIIVLRQLHRFMYDKSLFINPRIHSDDFAERIRLIDCLFPNLQARLLDFKHTFYLWRVGHNRLRTSKAIDPDCDPCDLNSLIKYWASNEGRIASPLNTFVTITIQISNDLISCNSWEDFINLSRSSLFNDWIYHDLSLDRYVVEKAQCALLSSGYFYANSSVMSINYGSLNFNIYRCNLIKEILHLQTLKFNNK